MTVTVPSREVLKQQDDEAWHRYAETCLDPRSSPGEKRRMFDLALDSLNMLFAYDQAAQS